MAVIDLNENELMSTFLAEAADDITALEAGLLALEENPDDSATRHELLRSAHTLKGNASCVGLTAITTFAHAYEDVLERVSSGSVVVDGELITLLLSGVDTFRRLLNDDTLTADDNALMERLTAGGGINSASMAVTSEGDLPKAKSNRTLRVSLERLNRMLDLAGEIAIARGRVQDALAMEGGLTVLAEVEQQIDVLQNELQELIMRARMVAVGPIFRQYARTVRDLAATHGKNARLVTIGDDVELDTSAIELLRDPLTHMIRNAIDHGIEPSPARAKMGKPPLGHVTLEAKHEAGSIIIRLSDDGAGLDRRAVAARARALGFDADRLTDTELLRLIFEPGFSTASEVTDLSGRGVGMDVVRRAIEALRGTISIESGEGKGTAFTIRLPLTLAVIDGFGIVAGDETWIVPMEHVVECLELPQGEPQMSATGVLLLRDEVVPYVRLRRLFSVAGTAPERENVLVVQHDGAKAGLVVDTLLGGNQAVIKPLGSYFSEVPGVAGSSILGSGRVALILDTPTILRNLAERNES
jgi:two-component system chemotaxis sensor kinase CheA